MEKTHQIVWDFLVDYVATYPLGLGKTLDIAYEDVLRGFDKAWCVQSLIATRSNLVDTWKIRP